MKNRDDSLVKSLVRPLMHCEWNRSVPSLFGADIAGGTNQTGFRDIAEFLDLGESFR
jgi:hypothetical protein